MLPLGRRARTAVCCLLPFALAQVGCRGRHDSITPPKGDEETTDGQGLGDPGDPMSPGDSVSPGDPVSSGDPVTAHSRTQTFDTEPSWVGVGNHPTSPSCVDVDQDFTYQTSNRAGGSPGEMGGKIWYSTQPAYYAKTIPTRTLDEPLAASGKLAVTNAPGRAGLLIGWFNSEPSRGWRENDSLAFRIDGDNILSVGLFEIMAEYATSDWSSGIVKPEIVGGIRPEIPAGDTTHTWALSYDPDGNDGTGSIELTVDGESWTLNLAPGHKEEGAVFDRFGILVRQVEVGAYLKVYFDDLHIDGVLEDFSTDPGWVGQNNVRQYEDCEVRPRHDFGYRASQYAGGAGAGEIGGLVWRTDAWDTDQAAYYADTSIGSLSLGDRLHAHGKLAMTRTCVDAGYYLGWFNTDTYDDTADLLAPGIFIGAIVEGRSVEGHRFNASYRTTAGYELQRQSPKIVPDGESLSWSIDYDPDLVDGNLVITLGGVRSVLTVPEASRGSGASLDAFGIGALRSEGHWTEMFFDDVTYTVE